VLAVEVADVIRTCLGGATAAVLPRRFGPEGTCLACRTPFGAAPLSVRAYDDGDGNVTLIAYHASCATSAWVHASPAVLPPRTSVTAMDAVSLRLPTRRSRRWHKGRGKRESGFQEQEMPIMLVHPCLEMARVRLVGPQDAISADVEEYYRLGFSDTGAFATAYPVPAVGQARMLVSGDTVSVGVSVHDQAWSAVARDSSPARLITERGGTLIGVTCDRDPVRLSADPGLLEAALGNGEVLLGWAPLSGDPPGAA